MQNINNKYLLSWFWDAILFGTDEVSDCLYVDAAEHVVVVAGFVAGPAGGLDIACTGCTAPFAPPKINK